MDDMPAWRAVLLMSLIPVATGCGGGGTSDRSQVLDTIRDSLKAKDRGDGAAECALLSPRARASALATVRALQTDPAYRDLIVDRSATARTCDEAMKLYPTVAIGPGLTAEPGAFDNLQDAHVTVRGDRATATDLVLPGSPTKLALVRIDGRWLIDTPP